MKSKKCADVKYRVNGQMSSPRQTLFDRHFVVDAFTKIHEHCQRSIKEDPTLFIRIMNCMLTEKGQNGQSLFTQKALWKCNLIQYFEQQHHVKSNTD